MLDKVDDTQVDLLVALCDGIIHGTSPDVVRPYLHRDFPVSELQAYLDGYAKPLDFPQFRQFVFDQLEWQATSQIRQLVLLCAVLNLRILSPAITKTTTLITEMTVEEREATLKQWRDSPIELKRKLFRLVNTLTMAAFVKLMTDLHGKAIGYPLTELRAQLEDQEVDYFKYQFVPNPQNSNVEVVVPEDVLVIGSGAGAGVVVDTLAQAGFLTLVLEKGKYFSNEELVMNDNDGTAALYENGGGVMLTSSQMLILAGSTFGGGTTVNWLACIPAPFKVRMEWYKEYGLDWVADERWDQNLKYVWTKMGALTDNIKHSHLNQIALDGAAKLGYKASPVNQNNGGNTLHDCGMCHLGCRFGVKQGSVNCWFRQATDMGLAKFMQQVKVERILHEKGKAYGVLCKDAETGVVFKIVGPKRIVVAGGLLQTPVLLQKLGFKNKHIGKNLKLHPVTVAFGDWGKDVDTEPHKHLIMTSVITEVDDYDGNAHGCKIETMLHAPFIEAVFFPWDGSDKARQNMLKYNHLLTMLLITRDKGSGLVTYDKNKPDVLVVDYEVSKFDREALLEGFLCASDVLYIEGAIEIFSPQLWAPKFTSTKPKHARDINDADYQKWRLEVAAIPFDTYGSPYGSAHQMSSCRATGKGLGLGACDDKNRLYDCKNVVVADASTMPTASGANPMITTMMFARHAALNLVEDLKPKAKI